MTDITELDQTMVNKLIQRIEVHSNKKKHSHNGVKVDIYFTAVGMVSVPDEKEILRIMEAIQARRKGTAKLVGLSA
jgi:phospholipid N-methyltransferase